MINKENVSREYVNLCEMAEKMIDSIIKYSSDEKNIMIRLAAFVFGTGKLYKVESRPGSGHNVHAAVDSLYNYKKKHSSVPIENYISKTFDWYVPIASRSFKTLSSMLQCFEYILYQQKNGNNTFEIDVEKYLKCMRNEILKNKDKLNKDNPTLNDWLAEKDQFFETEYKHHVL